MSSQVVRLVGVYHADGGLRGELAYVTGSLRGTTHCALCDVTHGTFRRRRSWDVLCSTLPVPFDLFHRNERSPELLAATGDRTPVVMVELSSGEYVEVLDATALDSVAGDVHGFGRILSAALERAGLEAAS
ncbi:MAG TPA: hypothetical protein VEV13_07170 [Candidatus Limnocylindria bacterium]|nr:hypothetical protein [Candidatus Limnocylindria bacterium]